MEKYTVVSKLDEVSKRIEKEIDDRLCQFAFIRDDENPETVIVVGGDGTFIYAVHQFMDRSKMYVAMVCIQVHWDFILIIRIMK